VGDPQHHHRIRGGKSSGAGSPQRTSSTIRELESPTSARGFWLVLGAAAGAFLAAGLIPLATAASARADGDDISPGVDTDFMSGPLQDFGLFTESHLPTLT
jgi:hypothetical protein